MQNLIPKFRQSSITFKKPGYFSENFKNPTTIEFNIFYRMYTVIIILHMKNFHYLKDRQPVLRQIKITNAVNQVMEIIN